MRSSEVRWQVKSPAHEADTYFVGQRLRRALMAISLIALMLMSVPARPASAFTCPCNMFGNATPGTVDSGDGSAVTLGMWFYSDAPGYVTGVRFYKAATNTGTHVGEIFARDRDFASGDTWLLGSVTFSNETASGWQTATFPYPVQIWPNKEYVIAYTDPNGHYSDDQYYFSTPTSNGPLHNIDPPGSSYTANATPGSFPNLNYRDSNYYVDPIFENFVGNVRSIFNMQEPTPSNTGIGATNEVGTQFSSDVTTEVVGIRMWYSGYFWHVPLGHLWDSNGNLLGDTGNLANGRFGTDWDAYVGWYEMWFDTPITINAGATYTASYLPNNGAAGYDTNYFTSQYNNGNLHIPANGGVYGNATGSTEFPTHQTSTNYWVEPILADDASVQTSVSVLPAFTFSVNGQSVGTGCNGVAASTANSSATSVPFGNLAAGNRAFDTQQLQVTTNAGGGFAVYLHSASGATNVMKGAGTHVISDSGNNVTVPAGGNEFFGYTTDASLGGISSGSISAVPTSSGNAIVANGAAGTAQNNCVEYAIGVSAATPADTYSSTVVYTALPTF